MSLLVLTIFNQMYALLKNRYEYNFISLFIFSYIGNIVFILYDEGMVCILFSIQKSCLMLMAVNNGVGG